MKPLTKNRAELLRLFFIDPRRAFYMQELGRILGKKPGVFQRTLNNMFSEGILESEYKANARYFKINKKYPLYKELKSIVFKTIGVRDSLRKILGKIGNIEFTFIYGSFAKGKENYLSDINLVIIGNPDEDKLVKELAKLEKRLQREVNYKLYTLKDIKREVSEKEPFFREVLRDEKVMIIGDESELREILTEMGKNQWNAGIDQVSG